MTEKELYRKTVNAEVGREAALNLILLRRDLKYATTVAYTKRLTATLKESGFQYVIDTSYVVESIHDFLEVSTKTPIPGAALNRRFYVGYGLHRQKLKDLTVASDFHQGILFCFPLCCNLHFCRKASLQKKTFVDIHTEWIGSLPGKRGQATFVKPKSVPVKYIDYRLIGAVLKYFQPIRLVQHVPCSPFCGESLALAERNLQVLREMDTSFYRQAVRDFSRPVILYGSDWADVGILQLDRISSAGKNGISGRCTAATHPHIRKGSKLNIRLFPHKGIEIREGNSLIERQSAVRKIPWSYCCLVPFDSLAEKS